MKTGLCGHYIGGRHVRHVCRPCYNRLYKLVKSGATTWEQLEQAGKVSKPTPKAEISKKYFLFRNNK